MADFTKSYDELSKESFQAYVDNSNPFQNLGGALLGDELFPNSDIPGLEYAYMKGAGNLVTMAFVEAHGAESKILVRKPIEEVKGSVPAITVKIFKSTRDIIRIIEGLRSPFERNKQLAIDSIYADSDTVRNAVAATVEWLRNQVLALGKVTIDWSEGLNQVVEYDVPATQQVSLTGTNKWDDHDNSNPIKNMMDWSALLLAAQGFRSTRAVTDGTTIQHLLQNVQIRRAVFGENSSERMLNQQQLNQFLRTMDLPEIASYDQRAAVQAADGTLTTKRFFPEAYFVMLPPSGYPVGATFTAPTAEEYDTPDEGVQVIGSERIVTQRWTTEDPKTVWHRAIANKFVGLPGSNYLFQAKVR